MASERRERIESIHLARASVHRKFKLKWDEMAENSKFLRLLQYSDKQLSKMKEDGRVPYVLDYLNSSINTFQGIQRDRRTEIFYFPSEKSDEVAAEVLNVVKDAKLRENNFIYIESDVFLDGLVQKLGGVTYDWSKEKNKNGTLKISRIHPRCVMWDLNALEYDKTDAVWIATHEFLSKREMKVLFPDKAKIIDKMSFDPDELFDLNLTSEYRQSLIDDDRDALALIKYYEKRWEPRYFIQDVSSGLYEATYYDTLKAAEEEIEKKKAEAEQQQMAGVTDSVEFTVKRDTYPVVYKTCVAGETELSHECIDEPFFPVDIYHPFWVDGDWYCPLDVQKDGQRYFNKMFSMADHWIGTQSKGLILYNTSAVNKAEADRVKKAFSGTGGLVGVKDIDNYKEFQSAGPAPQLFTLMELAKTTMEENAGGRNFQGRKETASESGVAVRSRVEQAGLSAFVIFDNLRRWKMAVGEHMAWYLTTYMTYPEVLRIEGEELVSQVEKTFSQSVGREWFQKSEIKPGVGYFSVNTEAQNTIENLKVDCIVDEARWSVSKNQAILQEINLSMQSNPNLAKTFPPEVMLEFMNLPFSTKQEAHVRIKQLEQIQMQIEAMKVQSQAAISASLTDMLDLPPEVAAQFLQKYFGIQADPSRIQSKKGQEMKLDAAKVMMDMQMKKEEHSFDMQAKVMEQGLDMKAKQDELEMKSKSEKLKLATNILGSHQKLQHAERSQLLKEKTNGEKETK